MDKSFLPENFLLSNPTSERLYFEFAQGQPIFDYHCHIPPADIAGNRRFENLTQIWLAEGRYGDHYKWRVCEPTECPNALSRVTPPTTKSSWLTLAPSRPRFATRSRRRFPDVG